MVPSSVYVTVVMTESVAYFTATWALLAIVLAVERPTWWRQLAALVAVGVAVLARAQFVAVYAAFLLALVIAHLLLPQRRRLGWRGGLRMLWPAAASLVLGLVLFVSGPYSAEEAPETRSAATSTCYAATTSRPSASGSSCTRRRSSSTSP